MTSGRSYVRVRGLRSYGAGGAAMPGRVEARPSAGAGSSRADAATAPGAGPDHHPDHHPARRQRLDAQHARFGQRPIVAKSGSCHRSSATCRITSVAAPMSASYATATSTIARDHCCDLLPTRGIVPFGTCHTTPSSSRHARGAQAHAFDRAGRDAGVDHVADTELVLDQHEDPGEEVARRGLRAEARTRCPTIPAPGDERRQVDAERPRGRSAPRSPRSRW